MEILVVVGGIAEEEIDWALLEEQFAVGEGLVVTGGADVSRFALAEYLVDTAFLNGGDGGVPAGFGEGVEDGLAGQDGLGIFLDAVDFGQCAAEHGREAHRRHAGHHDPRRYPHRRQRFDSSEFFRKALPEMDADGVRREKE